MISPFVMPNQSTGLLRPGTEKRSWLCVLPGCRRVPLFANPYCIRHRERAGHFRPDVPKLSRLRRWRYGSIYEDVDAKHGAMREYLMAYPDGDLKPHRLDGPAVVEWLPDGSLQSEEWYVEGVRHREDGPAVVFRSPDGQGGRMEWWREGKLHRTDGPAFVSHGQKYHHERWYLRGELTRLDGPAEVEYLDGQVTNERWWLGGWSSLRGLRNAALHVPSEILLEAALASSYVGSIAAGHSPDEILDVLAEGVSTAEGVAEVLSGAPAEWVRAFEEASS